ncbi:MAG: FecR domain-containing protein [Chitinophagaceae bacterium]|jgi:ferric-dicitrate binding protein FerR (iron transport regulator)|nr:FecR domain-containing protein [Chitinophagaceae bacterium]
MNKVFNQAADVLADEEFSAWYFRQSPEAVQEWEQWLQANPQYSMLVEEAIAFMEAMPRERVMRNEADTEKQLQQLTRRISETAELPATPLKKRTYRIFWQAAAAVLLLAGAFGIWKWVTPAETSLRTAYGQTISEALPDGSNLLLNANSQVKLGKSWNNGKDRELWLDGEAFFSVKKTPEKSRFIVHAGTARIEVTGTRFNVKSRHNKLSVYLAEGGVKVHTSAGKVISLKPGDYLDLEKGETVSQPSNQEDILAWRDNRLSFNNTSLAEVAQAINDYYGTKVILGDEELKRLSLTGILPNDKLDNLLEAIKEALDLKITRTQDTILMEAGNR